MALLILGLALFLGAHSLRIVADGWRATRIGKMGPKPWKGVVSVVSIIGFVLIIWGYGIARQTPVVLYTPPAWARHVAALLTLPAFILLVAAYVPGTRIKRAIGHPMVAGVKLWAFAHLLANGTLADVVLFGAFLAWAVCQFSCGAPPRPRSRCRLPRRPDHARCHRGRRWCAGLGGVRLLAARLADRRAAVRIAAPRRATFPPQRAHRGKAAAVCSTALAFAQDDDENSSRIVAPRGLDALAAWTVLLAGCTYYAPPPGPSTYDRAYNAMLGAMSDQGVKISDANPASGLITGQRGGISVTATVAPQADGTTKVEFRTRGDTNQDPQLIDRITAAYNARMGR